MHKRKTPPLPAKEHQPELEQADRDDAGNQGARPILSSVFETSP